MLLSIFEQVRQSPRAPYEPERLLAFLTDPPAPEGRGVAAKIAKPDQGLRLAKQRLDQARKRGSRIR